jgi:hypothetical protein
MGLHVAAGLAVLDTKRQHKMALDRSSSVREFLLLLDCLI